MDWYTWSNGVQTGPVAAEQLRAWAASGDLTAATLVWRPGLDGWLPWRQALGPAPGEPSGRCARCGQEYSENDLASWGGAEVCAWCKPRHLAALREGGERPGGLPYASWGVRFAARMLDGVIMGFVNGILQFGGMLLAGFFVSRGSSPSAILLLGLGSTILMLLQIGSQVFYETWFTAKKGGTPGKMILEIKVTDGLGQPITLRRSLGRSFAQWLTSMSLGLGYLTPFWDREKRALHDMVADTRVVSRERSW